MDVNKIAATMMLKQPWVRSTRSTTCLSAHIKAKKPFHFAVVCYEYFLNVNPVGVLPRSLEEGRVITDHMLSSTCLAYKDRSSNFLWRSVALVQVCEKFCNKELSRRLIAFVLSFLQSWGYKEYRLKIWYGSLKEKILPRHLEDICCFALFPIPRELYLFKNLWKKMYYCFLLCQSKLLTLQHAAAGNYIYLVIKKSILFAFVLSDLQIHSLQVERFLLTSAS